MDPQTKAMHDILSKLQSANPKLMNEKVETVYHQLTEAADTDVDLKVAMNSKIEESSVTVQNYRIDVVLNEFAGREKRFYNIVESNTNRIIHQELALFETAMAIVKKYMTGKSGVSELEHFDMQYATALEEVWTQNSRAKRGINEDIALAKASDAKRKVAEAKRKILQRL
jgi:hypothetical protein